MSKAYQFQRDAERKSLESIFNQFVASSGKKPWLEILGEFESEIMDELKQLKHACNLLDYADQRKGTLQTEKESWVC